MQWDKDGNNLLLGDGADAAGHAGTNQVVVYDCGFQLDTLVHIDVQIQLVQNPTCVILSQIQMLHKSGSVGTEFIKLQGASGEAFNYNYYNHHSSFL